MIAFIWQDDWNVIAHSLVDSLIAADHEVSVFVRNGQNSGRIAATTLPENAHRAKTLATAVEEADTILTLLSTPQEVEDVYLGEGGIFSCAAPGSLLIDLSTSSPRLARELNALAAVHDLSYVEAPLEESFGEGDEGVDEGAGGDAGELRVLAGGGTGGLRILAAGESDNLERSYSILQALNARVTEVGLPGNATTLKLTSRIALANTLMGVVEALTFAMNSGIDKEVILASLDRGVTATAVQKTFGRWILQEDFSQGIELRLFLNELTTAFEAADELDLTLPGLETAHQLYDLLVLVGGGQKGIHALALIYCDEEHSNKHGLNWELAQRAMDIYERAGDSYDDYDYDDYDDDECDDPGCNHHHHHGEENPPSMGGFFSSN